MNRKYFDYNSDVTERMRGITILNVKVILPVLSYVAYNTTCLVNLSCEYEKLYKFYYNRITKYNYITQVYMDNILHINPKQFSMML